MLRALYSKLPLSLRNSSVVCRVKSAVLPHDVLYDRTYYETAVEDAAVHSAPMIAASVVDHFKPASLVDLGCGTGAMLDQYVKLGIETHGLEYAEAGLEFCRERGLNVTKFDIESDQVEGIGRFDVVTCMEVAEHLPEHCADRLVETLANLGDCVVFTAAGPGQEGKDHVNLQPKSYWIEKFEKLGFRFDEALTAEWAERWEAEGVTSWYWVNLIVLTKA